MTKPTEARAVVVETLETPPGFYPHIVQRISIAPRNRRVIMEFETEDQARLNVDHCGYYGDRNRILHVTDAPPDLDKAEKEKQIRIKYQDIVYRICNLTERPGDISQIENVVERVAAMAEKPDVDKGLRKLIHRLWQSLEDVLDNVDLTQFRCTVTEKEMREDIAEAKALMETDDGDN